MLISPKSLTAEIVKFFSLFTSKCYSFPVLNKSREIKPYLESRFIKIVAQNIRQLADELFDSNRKFYNSNNLKKITIMTDGPAKEKKTWNNHLLYINGIVQDPYDSNSTDISEYAKPKSIKEKNLFENLKIHCLIYEMAFIGFDLIERDIHYVANGEKLKEEQERMLEIIYVFKEEALRYLLLINNGNMNLQEYRELILGTFIDTCKLTPKTKIPDLVLHSLINVFLDNHCAVIDISAGNKFLKKSLMSGHLSSFYRCFLHIREDKYISLERDITKIKKQIFLYLNSKKIPAAEFFRSFFQKVEIEIEYYKMYYYLWIIYILGLYRINQLSIDVLEYLLYPDFFSNFFYLLTNKDRFSFINFLIKNTVEKRIQNPILSVISKIVDNVCDISETSYIQQALKIRYENIKNLNELSLLLNVIFEIYENLELTNIEKRFLFLLLKVNLKGMIQYIFEMRVIFNFREIIELKRIISFHVVIKDEKSISFDFESKAQLLRKAIHDLYIQTVEKKLNMKLNTEKRRMFYRIFGHSTYPEAINQFRHLIDRSSPKIRELFLKQDMVFFFESVLEGNFKEKRYQGGSLKIAFTRVNLSSKWKNGERLILGRQNLKSSLNGNGKRVHKRSKSIESENASNALSKKKLNPLFLYTGIDSDDIFDLFLLDTKFKSSILHYFDLPEKNLALFGTLLNGENRVLVIKDERKIPVARAILRLMIDEKFNPLLFLERMYESRESKEHEKHMILFARKRARKLELPLVSVDMGKNHNMRSYKGKAISLGGRNSLYDYFDIGEGKIVQRNEEYSISEPMHYLYYPSASHSCTDLNSKCQKDLLTENGNHQDPQS